MRFRASSPPWRSFQELLRSCADGPVSPSRIKAIHAQAVVSGLLLSDVYSSNLLLGGYSKCASFTDARFLFDGMPQRNLVSWSSLISMYTQNSRPEEALSLFSAFQRASGDRPNDFIFASLLRACVESDGFWRASQVHGMVLKMGYQSDVFVGTALINFYKNVGLMEEAMAIFGGLSKANSVTWTAMIAGYSQIGRSDVSLLLVKQMRDARVDPDRFLLSSALSACAASEFLDGGRQIHGYVLRSGADMDISVNNVLIDLYCKCSRTRTARRVFDSMPCRNIVSWTTMIAGHMQNSFDEESMDMFFEMCRSGFAPDAFACTSVLSSCGSSECLLQGRQVHGYVIKADLESDEYVKNGLMDMYAKCGSVTDARAVFDVTSAKSVISYNTMIEGYARQGEILEALDLFNKMRYGPLQPGILTYVSLLGVSATLSAVGLSRQVHADAIKCGISSHLFAGCALIDVYSKCSCVNDARMVFDGMKCRDLAVWNAMLSGYNQNGEGEESMRLFGHLSRDGLRPCEFTFVALVAAAASLSSISHGLQFHGQILKSGLESGPHASNALIDMYAKCGFIREAWTLFQSIRQRDVVCWNSMISTFAQHGHAEEAIRVFQLMRIEEIEPNYITFVGLLSSCSHVGLVSEGLSHFHSMKDDFGIEPGMEHYASMVTLLGRAGRLHEAKEFIENMPVKPAAIVWRSLLSSCRGCGDVELGAYAARMAIAMDPRDSGPYVLLSSIFASKGMWADVEKVRKGMDRSGAVKEPGFSWIEVLNEVHVFISRGKGHVQADLIYAVLDVLTQLMRGVGCVPDSITLTSEELQAF